MDKWHQEKVKFYQLINWMSGEEKGLINKFDIGFITKDNRYIIANEDIEVLIIFKFSYFFLFFFLYLYY